MVAEPRTQPSLDEALVVQEPVQRLKNLLRADLSFAGSPTGYGLHTLHAFAAKFPPQLPRYFIESLTEPGEIVLDPMSGSGTAVLEASYLQRQAIAVDLDPLALMIVEAKTNSPSPAAIDDAVQRVLLRAKGVSAKESDRQLESRFDARTHEFIGYWFTKEVTRSLMALILGIEGEEDERISNFLKVLFSSVIVTKSGGVSRARDLAHTRPHRVDDKKIPDPFIEFNKRASKAVAALSKSSNEWNHDASRASVRVMAGDARSLQRNPNNDQLAQIENDSIDLIVTSPPYANAIDYMRAHKFSLIWFGYPISDLSQRRRTYIGYETAQEILFATTPLVADMVAKVAARGDIHRANTLSQYFKDMWIAISEMHRVLKRGKALILVVGPSTIRDVWIETHSCLAEMMEMSEFRVVHVAERAIDRDKRLMPATAKGPTMQGIEKRMHREFVIGAVKI
jgi:hypothetical protein